MLLENAVSKLNSINWGSVGTVISEEDTNLGYEFLRRMAQFFKAEQLKPMPPAFTNVAKLLGDQEEELDISAYCSSEAVAYLNQNSYVKRIFEYYLQLAKYAENNTGISQYLDIYEPLIKLFERGGSFTIKPLSLEIIQVSHFPLNNWYEKFVEKDPIDINNL
ncbi:MULTISPECIES: hypothetical protein [unclassified Paenibacillus]|uniref:hypothetical protein n=1 Tax=unclassified Paenibacillus TaxID=185978 RepID=UPI0009233F5C|nr:MULTISPECIES: hypothetical protein [unclassified Paenibacillus]SHN80783.1 hypothetical protein SAMN04487896_4600 [Paenibacillus sp. ov031]SLK01651.1 hypothetical protein SAMN06272722_10393 [Paenibacillus sp. RU5A]SOC68781.1 hypothetical protein SAMN05880581_10393 [Paenibacillus sp. RU26A]SOC71225.1 hypothetical protein SAMN05880586_10393 [Paenibacillus sp. RU5M]